MHPLFLFRQCDAEYMWERNFHFQSPSIFLFIEYCIELKIREKKEMKKKRKFSLFLILIKKRKKIYETVVVYIEIRRIYQDIEFLFINLTNKNKISWLMEKGIRLGINW
ncbi:hypothetical protein Nepgr_033825 [Nepenthes gracilis]|uniref:Uncharacterized protein n=1 Tax=Nepenthes gracilis TaxID=150966 RepID=A0AAD3Y953_NEPGR|nr:hypothetical protein Nepgr_033825 [Nepenthes gracilis]